MVGRFDDKGSACPSDSGVNDHQKDGLRWEIVKGYREPESRLANLLWLNFMADVDQLQMGVDPEHDPFHRSDIGVTLAEVREQGDNSCGHEGEPYSKVCVILSRLAQMLNTKWCSRKPGGEVFSHSATKSASVTDSRI